MPHNLLFLPATITKKSACFWKDCLWEHRWLWSLTIGPSPVSCTGQQALNAASFPCTLTWNVHTFPQNLQSYDRDKPLLCALDQLSHWVEWTSHTPYSCPVLSAHITNVCTLGAKSRDRQHSHHQHDSTLMTGHQLLQHFNNNHIKMSWNISTMGRKLWTHGHVHGLKTCAALNVKYRIKKKTKRLTYKNN